MNISFPARSNKPWEKKHTSAIARAVKLAPRMRSCAAGSLGSASRIARNTRLDIKPSRR